jgi:hypothetical protein
LPSSAIPHSPQNFSPGSFSTLHERQRILSGAPHSAQNFRPSRFSTEHFEQRMSGAQFCQSAFGAFQAPGIEALASAGAQTPQNFLLTGFSAPNLKHSIYPLSSSSTAIASFEVVGIKLSVNQL